MKFIGRTARFGVLPLIALLFLCTTAYSLPSPVGPALAGTGDGLNSLWVGTSGPKPNNVADAKALLASGGSSSTGFVAPFIDYADAPYGNAVTPAFFPTPGGLGDKFAVSYTGFLNITSSGMYDFRAYTDDGFQMNLGSEMIFEFDANRSPGVSEISDVSLGEGLYEFEFIIWEQGGAFVIELAWMNPGDNSWTVLGQENFFTSAPDPVPEPATLLLLGSGLAGLAGFGRRKFFNK